MNLYIRFLITLIASFFKPRLRDILLASHLKFRVWPNDLDFNGHMNNGRYLTVMDLGRFDLILRSGMLKMMLRQKSVPVLSAAKIRYRLPLHPFEEFELVTRIIGWDEKWVFIEQRFLKLHGPKAGAVAAIALVKGSFFDQRNKNTVPTQTLLDFIGYKEESPALPDHVQKWQVAEDALKDVTRSEI